MVEPIPLLHLIILFSVLFILGTVLTIPLFHFDIHAFVRSRLFIKIVFWVPIFIIFLLMLYASDSLRVILLVLLLLSALIEFIRVVRTKKSRLLLLAYFLLFTLGLLHFYFIGSKYPASFVSLLIVVCFVTVLSDVCAFFFGNYLGRHALPRWLNRKKSWEGVAGQLFGALVGVLLVNAFVIPVASLWLFIPLGIGSALGDLMNSFAKRLAGIKDWSQAIPGHGGFIDRLSSMAGSVVLLFYFLLITGLI